MDVQTEDAVTMDDTILATLRGIEERGDTVESEVQPPEAAKPDNVGQDAAEGTAASDRNEKGQFKPKEAKAGVDPSKGAPAASEAEADPAAGGEVDVPLRADGKPVDLNRPPSEWKPAAKAEWAKLPTTIRSEILRRETDAFKKVQEVLPEADFGRTMRTALQPYQAAIQMDGGGDPIRAIVGLASAAQVLRFGTPQEKQRCMQQIAQTYGIPLAQPGGETQEQQHQGPLYDPRVDQILQNMQREERARSASLEAQAATAAQSFFSATDATGAPRYPFVDNVMDDMVMRAQVLRRQNPGLTHEKVLEQAYEAAAWANPEVRAQLIQQQQQAQTAQAKEANLRKVAEAKRAASGNLPRRGSVPGAEPVGKMEDTILETYRQLTAG